MSRVKWCRHRRKPYLYTRRVLGRDDMITIEQLVCDCGEMLPFGPANDAGVEIEIRAAELANIRPSQGWEWMNERDGWVAHMIDRKPLDDGWAGWLAREIATHGEEP